MTVIIKGKLRDLVSFVAHLKKRNRIFRKAAASVLPPGKINEAALRLHPHRQEMEITAVIDETPDTKTYRLKMADPDKKPAFFRAGQYISCAFTTGGSTVYRPFSISSEPGQTLTDGTYDISIKKTDDGFISRYTGENWKTGVRVFCTGPAGDFYYQRLRDHKTIICIGGGSGITPFKSIIPDVISKYPDVGLVLLHGSVDPDGFIFKPFFTRLQAQNPSRFTYIPVCSGSGDNWSGETGFISADLIRSAAGSLDDCSIFYCGPPLMAGYLERQFSELNLKPKQLRKERYAVNRIESDGGPREFMLKINMNTEKHSIKAFGNETILVAMERAGLNPPSLCRSGDCGWCRSRLISGEVTSPEQPRGLRQADRKFGYIHPCCEFPASDLELYVPDNPLKISGEQKMIIIADSALQLEQSTIKKLNIEVAEYSHVSERRELSGFNGYDQGTKGSAAHASER